MPVVLDQTDNPRCGEGSTVKIAFNGFEFDPPVSGYPHADMRLGNYRLVKFWEPKAMELFNIRKHVGETNGPASTMPQKVRELHDKIMRYLRSMAAETLNQWKVVIPSRQRIDRLSLQRMAFG